MNLIIFYSIMLIMTLTDLTTIRSSKRDHIWSTSGIDPLIQSLGKRCMML